MTIWKKPKQPKKKGGPGRPTLREGSPQDSLDVVRQRLLSFRGVTRLYPGVMGSLDTARKERFVDWLLEQPLGLLNDLSEVLVHLSQYGQEALLLGTLLRNGAAARQRLEEE